MESQPKDIIRFPLDRILGSEANVRVLRVLTERSGKPASIASIAKWSGLSVPGTRKALIRLKDTTLINQIGSGRSRQYSLNNSSVFAGPLTELMGVERQSFENLVESLRRAIRDISEIKSAWINEIPKSSSQPIEIEIVTTAKAMSWISEEIQARVLPIEEEYDLMIDPVVYTRADQKKSGVGAIILVANLEAKKQEWGDKAHSQKFKDERSLAMHRAIAELIKNDERLIDRAKQHLNRLVHANMGTSYKDVNEWRQILEGYSVYRLCDFIVAETSRATRLRQSSPFFAVLTDEERHIILNDLIL